MGKDGNAFAILSRVSQALRSSGYSTEEMDRYHREATSGDFNHLLQVTMAWVDDVGVEDEGEEDA